VFLGCQDSPARKLDLTIFELVTLDENENESDVIRAGEDVYFGLKLVNAGEDAIEWRYAYLCRMFQSEEFLVVYQQTKIASSDSAIGTPYQRPIYCFLFNIPGTLLPPGEKLIINLPWSNDSGNKPLSTGRYYTKARFELTKQGESKTWDLMHFFKVIP
jgi:hypothetical protein